MTGCNQKQCHSIEWLNIFRSVTFNRGGREVASKTTSQGVRLLTFLLKTHTANVAKQLNAGSIPVPSVWTDSQEVRHCLKRLVFAVMAERLKAAPR